MKSNLLLTLAVADIFGVAILGALQLEKAIISVDQATVVAKVNSNVEVPSLVINT